MNPARDRLKLSGIVIWTGERGRQQARLVAGMYRAAAGVPCERSAVIAGGRPGEARRRGEEEFRRGQGNGGRVIPAAAIRALASPVAAAAGNRIRWAVGARSAGAIGGTVGTGAFPGSAVITMLTSYREGLLSLDDLSLEFRARRWPRVPDVCPPELEPAREAIDDPEPYVPGSFDDVLLAYDLGWLSAADYDVLAGLAGPVQRGRRVP